ncbi:MAG TPA: hypothetical protein VFD75_14830 [Pyrinomonadaceae bacterium]|nr:hypothetical protein [Pyrinomonadaceae bacterium]
MSLKPADEPCIDSSMSDAAKPRAFSASELVQCDACSRTNPPTRASCLYCGAALEVTELNAFSPEPVPETGSSSAVSFHVVALDARQFELALVDQLAEMLNIKPVELRALLAHPTGAPLLAVKSGTQAQVAAQKLSERGMRTQVISDEQLWPERSPVAISTLEILEDALAGKVGRSNQIVSALWDEITLIVSGRLYFETREIVQKRRRAKQVIDEREMLTDEAVLDIYTRGDEHGWRIHASNFDFSCLGESKKLTTFENLLSLTSLLRAHASAALFDDWYVRLRSALNDVWPRDSSASVKERRRTAFGDFDSSVTSIDNQIQFTRYSRLLRYLHASQAEDHAAQK